MQTENSAITAMPSGFCCGPKRRSVWWNAMKLYTRAYEAVHGAAPEEIPYVFDFRM